MPKTHSTFLAEHGARSDIRYASCACGWSGPPRRSLHTARGEALAHLRGEVLASYTVRPDGTVDYRFERGTSASRDENRLSEEDRATIRGAIGSQLLGVREPSIARDFNHLARVAYRSIGCTGYDLRQSECDEIADMVAAAILDASEFAEVRS